MAFDAGTFGGSFLSAFTQAQQSAQANKQEQEEKKARLKLYEIQLEREKTAQAAQQQQQAALGELFSKLQGAPAGPVTPPNGLPDAQGPVPGGAPAKPMSLTELLADPSSAMLMLRSGMLKGEDLLKQEQGAATRKMMENLIGGAGGPSGMEMQGLKVGPSGEMMPDFGLPQVTSPQTVMGPGGLELATFNPRTGARTATLGAPKPDTVTPDTAGRISGLQQAQEIAQNVMTKFVSPDGKIDRKLVITSFGRVPGSEGRKIRDDLSIAIDSVLRARTGAGVNKEEMAQVVDQFLPHPFDSDEEIINKGLRLQQFIGGALDTVTLPPSVLKRMQKQGGQSQTNGRVIDFSQLPK